MRKWTYLVAALLMAGTTATFTGCIDTDEPEGIAELRGAKSELIKAQAAVELVEVEMKKAQVAHQELLNKAQELANKSAEYDNQLKELDVKLKELKVELEQAKNEAEKAKLEAEIAKSNADKAKIENEMALAAERFKADMLAAQERTVQAQQYYEEAMRALEASKLILTDEEKDVISKAQLYLQNAAEAMNSKSKALKKAQQTYYDALTNPEIPTLAVLQVELKKAQIDVEKAEILLKEKNNMLALAEDFDAAAWDAKVKELDKQISEYESKQSEALYNIEKIKVSPAYKAAEENVAKNKKLKKEAQKAYENAKNDSITQVDELLDIKEYKSEPINAALKELFKKSSDFAGLSGYDIATGVFSYDAAQYTQTQYNDDLKKEDEATRTSTAFVRLRTVNAWVETLKGYGVDENGVEWNKLALAEKEKAAEAAKKAYEEAKAKWEISVKAVKGTATPVPTEDLKKATDAYNKAYTALANAVTAYNTVYDETYKAAYDKYISETKAIKENQLYVSGLEALLKAESDNIYNGEYIGWSAGKKDAEKIAKLEGYLKNFGKTAEIAGAKATAKTKTDEFYADAANKAALESAADAKGTAALASSDKVTAANKALNEANTAVLKAFAKVQPAIDEYENVAANPYGQVFAKVVSLDDLTGTGAFFGNEEDKDGNLTGHKKALRSDIAADEFTKLSETKLNHNTALNALSITSQDVFGNVYREDRLVEVTEVMARAYVEQNNNASLSDFGVLGIMLMANDDVQLCKDMIAAAELIKPLQAQMEGVLAALNKEIDANTALMNPFIAKANETRTALKDAENEVKKAKEERDALTAEDEANAQKFEDLVEDYKGLKDTVQEQINAINNGKVNNGSTVTVESVILYWKEQIAKQEGAVEAAKQNVIAAEKNIELFNNGQYTAAYELRHLENKLKTAQEAYDTAKAIYDAALKQVQSVLATLTK